MKLDPCGEWKHSPKTKVMRDNTHFIISSLIPRDAREYLPFLKKKTRKNFLPMLLRFLFMACVLCNSIHCHRRRRRPSQVYRHFPLLFECFYNKWSESESELCVTNNGSGTVDERRILVHTSTSSSIKQKKWKLDRLAVGAETERREKEKRFTFFLSFSALRWLDGIILCIIQRVEFVIAQGMNGRKAARSKSRREELMRMDQMVEMNEWKKAPRYFLHSLYIILSCCECIYHRSSHSHLMKIIRSEGALRERERRDGREKMMKNGVGVQRFSY